MADGDGTTARVLLTTCPDAATAERLARLLVERRLAACVQLVPGATSIYRWRGAIERADEVLVSVKTVARRVRDVEALLAAEHPYDVPELVVLEPRQVGAAYLAWLVEESHDAEPSGRAT